MTGRARPPRMIRALAAATVLALALYMLPGAALAPPALAGCPDAPLKGVDWHGCKKNGLNLAGVDMTGAVIRDASFNSGSLKGAILAETDGRGVQFIATDLQGAVFDKANLRKSDFTNADLRGASFRDANLWRARFFKANLRGADFTGARVEDTDFFGADLSGATWTDGEFKCAEGSLGQCNWNSGRGQGESGTGDNGFCPAAAAHRAAAAPPPRHLPLLFRHPALFRYLQTWPAGARSTSSLAAECCNGLPCLRHART